MRVLVVNAGSSTLKLRLLGDGDEVEAKHDIDPWDGTADAAVLKPFEAMLAAADAVGHRIVHGGPQFGGPIVVDDDVVARIEALTPLAPLHQPRSVAALRAVSAALPDVPAVACFDTAFHATISPATAIYALPREWNERWGLRRYGFHGLSHEYAVHRAVELVGVDIEERRIVSCHLGAGASLCASYNGRSVDTTMGFTPLEGLVMATRSGSVDPGLVLWLLTEAGLSAEEVADGLERRSGLAGLSGTSGDLRDVLERVRDDDSSRLALMILLHRLRREIAAMVAALEGLDILVFTGGIGEHSPLVRADAGAGLGFLGVELDQERNVATTGDGEISAPGAAVRTVVVTAREDLAIARQVRATL